MTRLPSTESARTNSAWTARWCWTRKHVARPWNQYAFFRRTLDLPARPQRALVRVSADARYTLYVNGRRIHHGPARSFPQTQSFDTLDLAPALQAGKNAICAIVHQFGTGTFFASYRDASGFLLDGAIEAPDGSIPVSTPHHWLCREARGWRKDAARLSIQMGFQEHFDADADPPDWMSPDYQPAEDQGWTAPADVGPVGVHPWLAMEPRGVPLLADHVEPFASLLAQFSGENARGYKIADDVYHLPLQETRKREKSLIENPQAMLRESGELATVPALPDGNFAMAVLDLGQERAGHLMLDIADAAGDEIIDILYTEEADKTGAPVILGAPKIAISEEATASRYRCRPGSQRWESFHYLGFRYATLIFRNVQKPLKIRRVAIRQVHAAVEEIGSFECSDQRLQQIWRVGRETLRNCMFDAYVDCPWREQAQWWGDARVNFRINTSAFGDVSLLERGIRQLAQSQAPDGSLHAHPPSDVPRHRLPDFMLTWIGTLWDYYFYTGRAELPRECLPVMHRLLEFFAAHELRDGLIGAFDGFWIFLDWSNPHRADLSAVLNLMYLQALRYAAAICDVLGEAPRAAAYGAKAQLLAASAERHFWDPKAKVWRDGFDLQKNAPIDQTSQHANALAILLRLKPETHTALAKDVLIKPATSRRGKVITASPFFFSYVLDAIFEAGCRSEAIDLIRDKWGTMLDKGATTFWELWEPTIESRCHAWSASPVYHLTQHVLGVTAVDIAWKSVRIAPVLGALEFARGTVPSPLGPIRIEWEQAGEDQLAARIDIPPGMEAEFVSPLGEIRQLPPGSHQFHT